MLWWQCSSRQARTRCVDTKPRPSSQPPDTRTCACTFCVATYCPPPPRQSAVAAALAGFLEAVTPAAPMWLDVLGPALEAYLMVCHHQGHHPNTAVNELLYSSGDPAPAPAHASLGEAQPGDASHLGAEWVAGKRGRAARVSLHDAAARLLHLPIDLHHHHHHARGLDRPDTRSHTPRRHRREAASVPASVVGGVAALCSHARGTEAVLRQAAAVVTLSLCRAYGAAVMQAISSCELYVWRCVAACLRWPCVFCTRSPGRPPPSRAT